MGIHDRAWSGFRIVILSKTPMMAMRLEQAIATAVPAAEVQISSFEKYDQAYKFCKEHGDIGFFFISEDCHAAPFQEVFQELGTHFQGESKPFGVILYEKTSNRFCERVVDNNPFLIDYLATDSILDVTKTSTTIKNIWSEFLLAFESASLNQQMQASLIAQAEAVSGQDSIHFILRLTTNLCSEINLSWFESVALKWAPILSIVIPTLPPAIFNPHKTINDFLKLCTSDKIFNNDDITSFLGTKTPVCKKIFCLVETLELARRTNKLQETLEELSKFAKPGAPKLLRHIAKNKDRILEIERDAASLKGCKTA